MKPAVTIPNAKISFYSLALRATPDVCEGGFLKHDSLVTMLQNARVKFLKNHGMAENNIAPGVGFVISNLLVDYMGLVKEGSSFVIKLIPGEIFKNGKGCSLLYQVSNSDDKVVARAQTNIIFLDIAKEESTAMPLRFSQAVESSKPEEDKRPIFTRAAKL